MSRVLLVSGFLFLWISSSPVVAESLPSLRTDTGNQTAGPAAANASATNPQLMQNQNVNDNPPANTGNSVAAISASASAAVTGASAGAQTVGEARVDPASGASLVTPQANATVGGQAGAAADPGNNAGAAWNMTAVTAGATLQILGTPIYPAGPATATETVSLVAAGGTQPLPPNVTLTANAGATNLMARSLGAGGWQINGMQSQSTAANPTAPPIMINEFVPGLGVNRTVVGTQATAVGASLTIGAAINNAQQGVGPGVSSNWSLSAHGSYSTNSP